MNTNMEETKNEELEEKKPVKVKKIKKKNNEEVTKLTEENASLKEKLLRISADTQNMRKRFDEQLANVYKYDGEALVKKLLPVVDNFERAIKLDDANLTDELSQFLEGFKMIYGNILDILNSLEVKEIECLNQDFDPNFMEAVLTLHEDGILPNKVVDVMQKGYMYKDKVIRVALVKVSE